LPQDAFAPAKVNLFLHIGPVAGDGYHPICSLMVFADLGDRLVLTRGGGPALSIDGPFGEGLTADAGNLVARARAAVLTLAQIDLPPFELAVTKRLPLASGLGGGSSDAAAALRLIDGALNLNLGAEALAKMAESLGADVPACLAARPVVAWGRGQRLEAAPPMPALPAVLVNPGVAAPTAEIFAIFDRLEARDGRLDPDLPRAFETPGEVAQFLLGCSNDLEPAALARDSVIGEVLTLLGEHSETLLARLSGSGATCFALCATDNGAGRLAARLRELRPGWWIEPCQLGGPWTGSRDAGAPSPAAKAGL